VPSAESKYSLVTAAFGVPEVITASLIKTLPPETDNVAVGVVVPIPTLPLAKILILSALFVPKIKSPALNVPMANFLSLSVVP